LAAPNLRGGRIDFDHVDHIPEWRFVESPEIQLKIGDVLLVKDGSTLGMSGIVKSLPAPCTVNGSIAVIRANQSVVSGFLYYLINSDRFQRLIWVKRAGLGVPHLFQADLRGFRIPLPPLPIQSRIADILSTLDETIEQTESLIEKHQQIKGGLMHDLFTRGITPDGHLRPAADEAPQLYKKSSMGLIPQEWSLLNIEELLANSPSPMRSGPFGSALLKSELVEAGVPLLGIDNVFVERFEANFRRFVSRRKFEELSRYSVFPNDVAITIMGTVGRCCVIPPTIKEALSSKHIWVMTFDTARVLPGLVCWQLNHAPWAKRWLARQSQGGIMEAIQSSTLRRLRIPVPPIEEQHRIYELYTRCTKFIALEGAHLSKLRELKSGLMQDLLTSRGSVNVTAAANV
jgi:type I restriction enzyme S subunit